MRKLLIAFGIVALIFSVSFLAQIPQKICTAKIGTTLWNIERARTPKERERGLMDRTSLCKTCGMLFIFEEVSPKTFWMKNTLIPLDMYFYNSDGKLIDSVKNMRPERETKETMQYTSRPAQYVLEVTAGSTLLDPSALLPRKCF